MYPPSIQKLIDIFSKFPTVGPRTAARFVFYLIKIPREKVEELIKSIEELKAKIKICPLCFKSFEPAQIPEKLEAGKDEGEFCSICQDASRDKTLICIIEKEVDLEAIEKTGKFKGFYFILGGTISRIEKAKQKEERIEERIDKLIKRVEKDQIKEIILALNPTIEGQNTSLLLQRKLKNLGIKKITQLGQGLPVGGELEYADEETLSSALESRR
ncbi:MAG: recombination protein RecR [Candidatus Pacebacteria bacterium]|nr:recombination protein RecR [Candidatus Paceibacterota bacterium]